MSWFVYLLLFCSIIGLSFQSLFDWGGNGPLQIDFTSDGPVVLDANITFTVKLLSSGVKPIGSFYCVFSDNLDRVPYSTEASETGEFNWTRNYPSDSYLAGQYLASVTVYQNEFIFPVPRGSAKVPFNITETLNGHLEATQPNNTRRFPNYVSTANETILRVHFHDPERFLKSATEITYIWIIDQQEVGRTSEPIYQYNFTEERSYLISAYVFADFRAPTTTTTTTSTTSTTTTTTTTATTPTTISLTTSMMSSPPPTLSNEIPLGSSTLAPKSVIKRSAPSSGSYVGHKTGVFYMEVVAKVPVCNMTIMGNNWLKHGELFNDFVSCKGSGPFEMCFKIVPSTNVTGNETCETAVIGQVCTLPMIHYFSQSGTYSVQLIIRNDVSKVVKAIPVTIFDVDKKKQLSVIVVPIASGCVAIMIIVFGIGLYMHHQSRISVEVADFDFGEDEPAEPMTFFERLRSSFRIQGKNNGTGERNSTKRYGSTEALCRLDVNLE